MIFVFSAGVIFGLIAAAFLSIMDEEMEEGVNMVSRNRFRNNLLIAQGRSGKTQAEIARIAGLSERQYNSYLSGKYLPTAVNLMKMCKALEVSADVIMEGVVE